MGFGNSTAKLVELLEAVRMDDVEGGSEVYFPTYVDRLRDREVMVPLFPHYAFLKCRWHQGLEDRLRDMSGIYATFLRDVGALEPHVVTDDELERIKDALERRVEMVREWWHVDDLVVGDKVMVKSMGITGTILYFLPPQRAMIQTKMFNQETPCPVKIADLERL